MCVPPQGPHDHNEWENKSSEDVVVCRTRRRAAAAVLSCCYGPDSKLHTTLTQCMPVATSVCSTSHVVRSSVNVTIAIAIAIGIGHRDKTASFQRL